MDVIVDLDGTLADCTHRLHHIFAACEFDEPNAVIVALVKALAREHRFEPALAIDDRCRVVEMWRQERLVCAQVAEGEL